MDSSEPTPPAAGLTGQRDVISINEHVGQHRQSAQYKYLSSFPGAEGCRPLSTPSENDRLPVAHEQPIGRHLSVGCHTAPHEINYGHAFHAGCYCDKPLNYRTEREVMNDQHNYTWGHSTCLEREPLPGYISGETNLDEIKSQEPVEQNTMGLGAGGTLHEVKVEAPTSLDEIIDRHALTDAHRAAINQKIEKRQAARARFKHDVETGFTDYYPPNDDPSTAEVDPMAHVLKTINELSTKIDQMLNHSTLGVRVRVTHYVANPCRHIAEYIDHHLNELRTMLPRTVDRLELDCPVCDESYWLDIEGC